MNNEVPNKYLPLGTVCLLNGGKKLVMITGYCVVDPNNPDKIYDYSGAMYPEGQISSDFSLIFNHEQIKEIHFLGFVNDDGKDFCNKLKEVMSNGGAELIINKMKEASGATSSNNTNESQPQSTPEPAVTNQPLTNAQTENITFE